MWESLVGRRTWRPRIGQVLAQVTKSNDAPGMPEPQALRGVLRRGMLATPEDRFADVDALIAAVELAVERRGARRAS
jgi:hypothetical protein